MAKMAARAGTDQTGRPGRRHHGWRPGASPTRDSGPALPSFVSVKTARVASGAVDAVR